MYEITEEMKTLINKLQDYNENTQTEMKDFLVARLTYKNFGLDTVEYGKVFARALNEKVQEGIETLRKINDPSNQSYETELNKLKSYIKHSLDFVAVKTWLSIDEIKKHETLKQKIDQINNGELSFFDKLTQLIKNFLSNLKSTGKKPISSLKVSKDLNDILNYSQKAKIQTRFERE